MAAVVGEVDGVAVLDQDERVARLCFKADFPITHDDHFPSEIDPETRLYQLEEFQWKDFSTPERGGFSVQRMSLSGRSQAREILADRIRRKTERGKPTNGYDLEGVVVALVGEIGSIKDTDGADAFIVSPTPMPENAAHAAIRTSGRYDSARFLKYRLLLQRVFGQLQPLTVLSGEE